LKEFATVQRHAAFSELAFPRPTQSPFRFDGIEAGLWIPDLTRFLNANRLPTRLKTLWPLNFNIELR
jgi:hypothetical protein